VLTPSDKTFECPDMGDAKPFAPAVVHYFIPNDDDDVKQLNAFRISKSVESLRLRDVRSEFPLPGRYHFRFKLKHDGAFVWIDVTNENSAVPQYEGKITCKVLRISWDDTDSPSRPQTTSAAPQPAQHDVGMDLLVRDHVRRQQPAPPKADLVATVDFFGDGFGVPQAAQTDTSQSRKHSDDFDSLFR